MPNSIYTNIRITQHKCKASHPQAQLIGTQTLIDETDKKNNKFVRFKSRIVIIGDLSHQYETKYVFQATPELVEDINRFHDGKLPNLCEIEYLDGTVKKLQYCSPKIKILEEMKDRDDNLLCGIYM